MDRSLPRTTTIDEFEQFALLPANRDKRLEFIHGELVEVVSNDIAAMIGAKIVVLIGSFVWSNQLGFVTGEQGGYRIGEHDLIPDCAFVSKARRAGPQGETYARVVPDLIVEVKSPSDTYVGLVSKISLYLQADVRLAWLVLPDKRRVEVFTQDGSQSYGLGEQITGGDVLPGFVAIVSDIFSDLA
jgi:Uma2 family endonuclease